MVNYGLASYSCGFDLNMPAGPSSFALAFIDSSLDVEEAPSDMSSTSASIEAGMMRQFGLDH